MIRENSTDSDSDSDISQTTAMKSGGKVKRKNKYTQKQKQNIHIHIDNSRKTIRRNPNGKPMEKKYAGKYQTTIYDANSGKSDTNTAYKFI